MLFFLSALLILGAAILLLIFGPTGRTVLEIAIVVGGLVPHMIRRIPRAYLGLCKIHYEILNTPATWDMNVRYKGIFKDSLDDLSEQMITWGGNGSAFIARAPNRSVIRLMRRFVLEFYMHLPIDDREIENDAISELAVSMSPVTIGYRDSKSFLDNELLPLLEKLQKHLNPEEVCFSMRVDLPPRNPYYGFYLQQMKLAAINDFRIEFILPGHNEESRITVGKNRLTVVSSTIQNFRLAIAAALAFRVPEAKSCL